MRASWSLVQVDRFGNLQSAAFGAVPLEEAPLQVARDGEDFAVLMSTLVAQPPFEIYVDCQGTVDCLKQGPSIAAGVDNARAHLWTRFFTAFEYEDIGSHKTLAHATPADIDAGKSTWWEKKGNDAADEFAKKGARLHPLSDDEVLTVKACALVAKEAIRWAGQHEGWMVDNNISDCQSITDPPMAKCDGQGHDSVDEACFDLDVESRDGCFKGHTIRAASILHDDDDDEKVLCCTRCGAYARHHCRYLNSWCVGPTIVQKKRQRDRFCQGRFPGNGKLALGQARLPTLDELEWINADEVTQREGLLPLCSSSLAREEVLTCFGLQSEDDLRRWHNKVRQSQDDRRSNPDSESESDISDIGF